MYESPQMRRLRSDLAAMERLAQDSSILSFRTFGTPATRYLIEFRGRSLSREKGKVKFRDQHEVEVKLGSAYPRTMPELRWLSSIYHPNISEIGLVCLGGYGTHWVPSLHLDDLCNMLWDMARYHNYDIRSPYNRDAALWAANQTSFVFPTDARPLRDLRIARGRVEIEEAPRPEASQSTTVEAVEHNTEAAVANHPGTEGSKSDAARRLAEGESIVILDLEVNLADPEGRDQSPPPEEEMIFLE